ncbi:MAG TPA: hypothetical protein VLT47_04915 [Anaeromyxobacteraceae bacterium]|nr:hypothetical protein [Anaeromyxobacteraceae bacterium]
MTTSRRAAAAGAALALAFVALRPVPARGEPDGALSAAGTAFGARFRLSMASAGGAPERSEGSLFLLPDGRICVRVERPIRQDLLLSRERIVIHYPERSLILTADVRKGQVPPMLDSVVAGLGEASRLLPANSTLASRAVEAGLLRTRWNLPAVADGGGTVDVTEKGEGVVSFELRGTDGVVKRRYDFGPRQRVGRLRVPTTVRGDYRDPKGAVSRTEEWTLDGLTAEVAPTLARDCSGEGTASRREVLPW